MHWYAAWLARFGMVERNPAAFDVYVVSLESEQFDRPHAGIEQRLHNHGGRRRHVAYELGCKLVLDRPVTTAFLHPFDDRALSFSWPFPLADVGPFVADRVVPDRDKGRTALPIQGFGCCVGVKSPRGRIQVMLLDLPKKPRPKDLGQLRQEAGGSAAFQVGCSSLIKRRIYLLAENTFVEQFSLPQDTNGVCGLIIMGSGALKDMQTTHTPPKIPVGRSIPLYQHQSHFNLSKRTKRLPPARMPTAVAMSPQCGGMGLVGAMPEAYRISAAVQGDSG